MYVGRNEALLQHVVLQVIIRRDIVTALLINVPVTFILYSNGLKLPPLLPPTRCIQWCSSVVLYARLHVPVNWCDVSFIRVSLRRHRCPSTHNVNPIRPPVTKEKIARISPSQRFCNFFSIFARCFQLSGGPVVNICGTDQKQGLPVKNREKNCVRIYVESNETAIEKIEWIVCLKQKTQKD